MTAEEVVMSLTANITCPKCNHTQSENMPTNSCVFFYQCTSCDAVLRPLEGDCCVYCSYADVDCPPKANGEDCC